MSEGTPRGAWPADTDFRLESCQTFGCRNRWTRRHGQQRDAMVSQDAERPLLNLCTPCSDARSQQMQTKH